MKKILSVVLACTLLVASVFALSACFGSGEQLSGTYTATEGGYTFTYKFEGNKVTATASVYAELGIEGFSGTYSINGDKITFVFDVPTVSDATMQQTLASIVTEMNAHNKDLAFANNGDSITIDGQTLTKQK